MQSFHKYTFRIPIRKNIIFAIFMQFIAYFIMIISSIFIKVLLGVKWVLVKNTKTPYRNACQQFATSLKSLYSV